MQTSNSPHVSIVVLNYNGAAFLQTCLESIMYLNYSSFDVVVVDNASTDTSLEIINKFSLASIKVIRNEVNVGGNSGRNIGIANAKGDYVLLLDGDIEITDENVLEYLVEEYNRRDDVAFIQLPIIDIDKNLTTYYGIYFSWYDFETNLPKVSIDKILACKEKMIPIASPTGACLFFAKDRWDVIGPYDESQPYHMDEFDIGPKAMLMGYRNFLCTRSYLRHHGVLHVKNTKLFVRRFSYLFSGHARGMIKNYSVQSLFLRFPIFFIYHCLKAVVYSYKVRSLAVFFAFARSVINTVLNLPEILKERKHVQKRRVVSEDVFLKVRPPIFK